MIRKNAVLAAAALAVLLLASCGSSGILGGNDNGNYSQTVRGTVDSVDLNSRSILLTNASGLNSSLSSGGSVGNTVRVYFDDSTTVNYQGQNYRPENLDRGDVVEVYVRQSGNQLMADSMNVTYNANPNGTSTASGGVYAPSSLSGTVRSIDTSRRQLQIDRGYGSNVIVDYDTNTRVMYNGRSYLPGDLEVGDQVTISQRDIGSGRMVAQNIDVTRSMSSSSSGSNYATIRGTVRNVNTYNHTIDMEQASWVSGFLPNNRSSVVTVQYDTNAQIYVNGQLQPLSGLERGDMIEVQAQDLGNSTWRATRLTLVRDARQ